MQQRVYSFLLQALGTSTTIPNPPKLVQSVVSPTTALIIKTQEMLSIVDASTVVCEPAVTKRAASPALPGVSSCTPEPHQPLPQHEYPCTAGEPCSCKRRRTSQTEEMDASTESRTEAVESRSATYRGLVGPQQQRLGHCSNSRIHNFYTKASILSPRGIVDLGRVQVDERCSFNLLPRSIAMDLDLIVYSDWVLTITVANRLIQTDQFCRFTIRVAGLNTTINTGVIPGLQTVLLGHEWIQSVNLLSRFGSQSYYIPIPLAVEAAEERFPDVGDAVEMAMTDEIDEEYDDDECSNTDCGHDPLSDSELSPCDLSSDDERSLDDDPLSDRELSSGEPSSDGQRSLDGDPSGDELSLDDNHSSDGEASSGEELKTDEDDEDDEDYEGKEKYEEYEEGQKCQECQKGEDDTNANLQDFMKQHKHLEHPEPQRACETAKLEPEKALHCLTCLKNPLDRNDESVGDPALNMGSQQPEPKGERAFPSSHHIDNLKQPAAPSPITKRQTKEIANTLNHISRTQAGQNFKAPVEQLWPECADAYTAKVPNPIDLGTMEMKMKNNIYPSMDDFRADVNLLYENSLGFNGIDHIITSAALEVRDTILKAISDMEEGKGSTILRASIRGS